jgi:hypothetical protein
VAKSSQSRVKAEVEKPSRPDTRVWGAPCSPEQMFLAISALVSKFQPGSYVSVRVRLCRGLVGKWYEFISEKKKKKKRKKKKKKKKKRKKKGRRWFGGFCENSAFRWMQLCSVFLGVSNRVLYSLVC